MINDAGLAIIKDFEGFSPSVYRDPVGVPTIGYGSTWNSSGARVTMGHPDITEAEGEELLRGFVNCTEKAVGKLITAELTENMYAALVSLTYNIGSGNLRRSTLRKELNRGNYGGAADEFPKWRKAGGRVLPGLVRRRAAERELFLDGCD
jgi:lysozyme